MKDTGLHSLLGGQETPHVVGVPSINEVSVHLRTTTHDTFPQNPCRFTVDSSAECYGRSTLRLWSEVRSERPDGATMDQTDTETLNMCYRRVSVHWIVRDPTPHKCRDTVLVYFKPRVRDTYGFCGFNVLKLIVRQVRPVNLNFEGPCKNFQY